jgi:hypothetical protein
MPPPSKVLDSKERRVNNLAKCFSLSAGVTLLVTGLAKLWSGFGNARFLAVPDPILGIRFGHLISSVGVAEVIVALVCLMSRRPTFAGASVAWLATNLAVYRLGLWCIGWKRPCNCLGNLTDALHVSPALADSVMKLALAYLLIGSYALLFWRRGMQGATARG